MIHKFQILQVDISMGCKGSCTLCAAALALRRYFNTTNVSVGNFKLYVDGRRYLISNDLQLFIRQFDLSNNALPGEFEIKETIPWYSA